MDWFFLTLLSLGLMSSTYIVNKKTLSDARIDEVVFGGFVQLGTGSISLALALFAGWRYAWSPQISLQLLAMMAIYVVAVSLFYTGIKRVDVSYVTILESLGSLWSLLIGVSLLQEPLLITKVIAILCIVIAIGIISFRGKRFVLTKYEVAIAISSIFYASGAALDKILTAYGSPLSYVAVSFLLVGTTMLGVYWRRTLTFFQTNQRNTIFWKGLLINSACYSLAFWALFSAYKAGGEVSRMFPITQSQSIIVPVLGILMLKEHKEILKKVIAAAVLIIGLLFMRG